MSLSLTFFSFLNLWFNRERLNGFIFSNRFISVWLFTVNNYHCSVPFKQWSSTELVLKVRWPVNFLDCYLPAVLCSAREMFHRQTIMIHLGVFLPRLLIELLKKLSISLLFTAWTLLYYILKIMDKPSERMAF